MRYQRKVKVLCPAPWSHHRGGWPWCNNAIYRHLNIDSGTIFYTNAIIGSINQAPITKPWIAFLHVTKADRLEDFINDNNWKISLPWCLGFYVLSEHVAKYVRSLFEVNICKITYPVSPCDKVFTANNFFKNPTKRVVHVGHWLRKPEDTYKLKTSMTKTILNCTNKVYDSSKVEILGFLNPPEYDELLSKNIMFLSLEDAGANTSILEAIIRNTPVLVNKLEGPMEYLGDKYPLFYEDLEEASQKLSDDDLIIEAHEYIKKLDKSKFSIECFIESIATSNIYESLPVPLKLY